MKEPPRFNQLYRKRSSENVSQQDQMGTIAHHNNKKGENHAESNRVRR